MTFYRLFNTNKETLGYFTTEQLAKDYKSKLIVDSPNSYDLWIELCEFIA